MHHPSLSIQFGKVFETFIEADWQTPGIIINLEKNYAPIFYHFSV